MRSILIFVVGVLFSLPAYSVTTEEFLAMSGSKRKEVFQETPEWKANSPVAFKIGTREGLTSWELQLWMTILWNESRLRPDVEGDHGCARGAGQIHVGGNTWKIVETLESVKHRCPHLSGGHGICPAIQPKDGGTWVKSEQGSIYACTSDSRKLLPTKHPVYGDMTQLAPESFLKLEIGTTASALLFKQRIRYFSSPFDAAVSYAGCQDLGGKCSTFVLRRLKWWWETGLSESLSKLGGTKIAPCDQPSPSSKMATLL